MLDFKLHSSGPGWWHFRKDLNSGMESFTITTVHDGTIVLTGDYGVLAVRRDYFPENMGRLLGWPSNELGTGGIDYFSEKVCRYGQSFTVDIYDEEKARKDVEEYLKDYYEGSELKEKLELLDDIDFEYEYTVYAGLHKCFPDEEWENVGMKYSDIFKFQFELFKFWTGFVCGGTDEPKPGSN